MQGAPLAEGDKKMTTVTLEMPDEVFAATRNDPDGLKRDLRLAAAATWYRENRISQEVAARIAGLDRTEFLLAWRAWARIPSS